LIEGPLAGRGIMNTHESIESIESIDFNAEVLNAATCLSIGVDEAEVAGKIVARLGSELGFLIFSAAKVYVKLP
jgi:hypothetical protein